MVQCKFASYDCYRNKVSLIGVLLIAMQFSMPAVAQEGTAEKLLLDKAQYLNDKGDTESAIKVLNKLLTNIPDSLEGRFRLGLMETYRGNENAAKHQLLLLRQQHPGNQKINKLKQALSRSLGKNNALKHARDLARRHKTREAAVEYERYFNGKKPPAGVALEYYQVVSGLPDHWRSSKQGLEALLRSDPKNIHVQLALAKLLTYRGKTRQKGIRMLRALSGSDVQKEAQKQWKQALLWMPVRKPSVPAYNRYLKEVGADVEISNLIKQSRKVHLSARDRRERKISSTRKQAFSWMDQGNLQKSEKAFRLLLQSNPNDIDSIAGLGLVLLKEKKYSPALFYLSKASLLSPRKGKKWKRSLNIARHQSMLEEVNALDKKGDSDEAYQRLIRAIHLYPEQRSVWTRILARLQKNKPYSDALASALRHLKANPRQSENAQLFVEVYKESAKSRGNRRMLGQAIDVLETALFNVPNNNDVRLNLAYLYQLNGAVDKAIPLLDMMVKLHPKRYEAYYSRAQFFVQSKRWADASLSMRAIPANKQSFEMRELSKKINVHVRIARARALAHEGRHHEASRVLEPLTTSLDRNNVYQIATAWNDIGDVNKALRITRNVLEKQPKTDYGLKLFYASLLGSSHNDAEADIWLHQLDKKRNDMKQSEQADLDRLRRGSAIRKSDILRKQANYADAWEQLSPYLMDKPVDNEILLALARIYDSADQGEKNIPIYHQLLQQNPDNLDVIAAYVKTAIASHDYQTATDLVSKGIRLSPNSERFYILKGDLENSHGNYDAAMSAYRKAKHINRRHITAIGAGRSDISSVAGQRNPFRSIASVEQRQALSLPSGFADSKGGNAVTAQPLITLTDRMNEIRARRSTHINFGMDIRQRVGEQGLSLLSDIETPVQIDSVVGNGHLTLKMTTVLLSAGDLDLSNKNKAKRIGSYSINAALPQNRFVKQSDAGMAVQLSYSNTLIHADMGISPLGFNVVNFIGGLDLTLHPDKNMHVDLSASRRSMTDSLLSYAGLVDEPLGLKWGGVTRNKVGLSTGYDNPLFGFYGGVDLALLKGKSVKSNTSLSLYVGGYHMLTENDTMKTSIGLHISTLGYTQNLSYYTFGHGGYFSPQQYVSTTIPFTAEGRTGNLSYNFNVQLGIQSFQSDSAAYFPNNPAMQQISGKFYPAIRKTGALFGVKSAAEYQLSSRIITGAFFELDNAQKFNVYSIGAYLKYAFDPVMPRLDFGVVSPLRAYYLEGFR